MTQKANKIDVYLEVGQSRTFALAPDWPGWCRSGRDEAAALQSLGDYAPRYARVLQAAQIHFEAPAGASGLVVVERLAGNATTDFGAPSLALERDVAPVEPAELERWQAILPACWQALDGAAQAAAGRALRKGPRGGGRDLEKILQHVYEVEAAYLSSLGGKSAWKGEADPGRALAQLHSDILNTLAAARRGEIPERGPRGGVRWTPRYFVRRLAWHDLDHAWEIEDRVE